MKLFTYLFSILLFTVLNFSIFAKKQNVILFLIDDLGWSDLSLTGSKFYETPNIDRLASEGAFFTDAYAASPVCSPSRGSILTGKYPSRIKMTYISGTSGPKGSGYSLNAPPSEGNINPKDITLAEALRAKNYQTVHIGKWHLQNHTDKGKLIILRNMDLILTLPDSEWDSRVPIIFHIKVKGIQARMYPVWKMEKMETT